jgi:hypothetical protein
MQKQNWEIGDAAAESGRNVVTPYWLYADAELTIKQPNWTTYWLYAEIKLANQQCMTLSRVQIGDAAAESSYSTTHNTSSVRTI